MAVQVVRDHIDGLGFQLTNWQGNPEVDPSIWFVGKSKGPEWVVVRSVRYPAKDAEKPSNWDKIARHCAKRSHVGHFASVAMTNSNQLFGERDPFVPYGGGTGCSYDLQGCSSRTVLMPIDVINFGVTHL